MGFFRRKKKAPKPTPTPPSPAHRQSSPPSSPPPSSPSSPSSTNGGPRELLVKLVLMGDGAVGKTSLRERFMGHGFRTSHLMTIGADFASTNLVIGNNSVTLQIWDLAGQDMFSGVRGRFYNGAMGGLLVFDITRRETFLNLPRWIQEAWKFSGRGPIPFVILGNKYDLKDKAKVTLEEARKFADELNALTKQYGFQNHFMETSALTGLNVDKAFRYLAEYVIELINKREKK